ncbi:hypothetical protein SAMN05428989_3079 [Pseudoxanthomonas sp. GM95]|uniref:alpha/beta hydrolase n=1 Tax=Pseudoxanthomonas sp. GM95 TaxID=1881043 RepID=UPI0008CE78B8|nr:alpha/beta hydrolase [Pseudoxanthomonas sp. GM95]SEM11121.1 hypothetical protein SAMN05428989_3079 [Pseudoxanthomonas sp. GM95]
MTPTSLSIPRGTLQLAAHLYLPTDFNASRRYAAIVLATPGSSVKEQIGGTYARKLAGCGFVALTFDPAYQGQSSGTPRDLESPAERVADLSYAIDFLDTLDYVDATRIGALGLCAGGGYAVSASMTDHRIRALGTVVPVNIGNARRRPLASAPDKAIETLDRIAQEVTAEARGEPPVRQPWIPDTLEDAQAARITDVDLLQAVTYYRTARGHDPHSTNRRHPRSDALMLGYDAFHLADLLLTQPVQVIVGGASAGTTGSFEDGHTLAGHARASEPIFTVEGARHYEMYDVPAYVDQAIQQLDAFFGQHLGR